MFVQQISAFTLSTWKGIMFLFILLLLHQIRYASNHLVWQMVDTVFGKLCLHMSTSLSCLYIKWYEGSTWGHWFTGNFMGRMLAYNWCLTEQEKKVEHTGLTCFWSVSLWESHLLFVVPNLSPRLCKMRGSYFTDFLLVFDIQYTCICRLSNIQINNHFGNQLKDNVNVHRKLSDYSIWRKLSCQTRNCVCLCLCFFKLLIFQEPKIGLFSTEEIWIISTFYSQKFRMSSMPE